MSQYVVCALYKFVALDDYQEIRQPLTDVLEANQIRGTLLLAVKVSTVPLQVSANLSTLFLNGSNKILVWLMLFTKSRSTKNNHSNRTKVKLKKRS